MHILPVLILLGFNTLGIATTIAAEAKIATGAASADSGPCIPDTRPDDSNNNNPPARSIDTTPVSERDFDPSDIWPEDDAYANPPPGAPGALGHYPRPVPSRGSRPPVVVRKNRDKEKGGMYSEVKSRADGCVTAGERTG